MGTPSAHLPPPYDLKVIEILLSSIGYDPPLRIKPLNATAHYHIFYVLTYSTDAIAEKLGGNVTKPQSEEADLILRISGNHIPSIKTENEAAVLFWLQKNTKVPVPAVLVFDSEEKNVLGKEYMIMTKVPGIPISDIYDNLAPAQLDSILDQLSLVLLELHQIPFDHIGGLQTQRNSSEIVPGPVVEETFWHIPDIKQFWPAPESFETLNINDYYITFTLYISAHIGRYMTAIQIHESLAWLRPELPRLEAFLNKIHSADMAPKLNDIPLRLAHRDMHFANILVDPLTTQITGILDWEFAQVAPYPLWNSVKAFLWNGKQPEEESRPEKNRLYTLWEEKVKKTEEGRKMLEDAEWKNQEQEAMFQVWNFLRSIVEVCPRGQSLMQSREWWKKVEQNLDILGVGME